MILKANNVSSRVWALSIRSCKCVNEQRLFNKQQCKVICSQHKGSVTPPCNDIFYSEKINSIQVLNKD